MINTSTTSVNGMTLANFLLKILYPRLQTKVFLIYLYIKYIAQYKISKMSSEYEKNGMKCEVIPDMILMEIAEKNKSKSRMLKSPHFIIVPKFLFDQMYKENVYYRDENSVWVTAKIMEEVNIVPHVKQLLSNLKMINNVSHKKKTLVNDKEIYMERIVQICCADNGLENDSVYMSEAEQFSIKQNVFSDKLKLRFSSIVSESMIPKIASELTVEMVLPSVNIGLDLTDQMLINYFKTPKFLHHNDYFAIDLVEEYTGSLHYKYYSLLKSIRSIYFKCVKIRSRDECLVEDDSVNLGYFVVFGETELKQNQNFNSFIPRYQYTMLHTNAISNHKFIDNCPYGLHKCFDELKKCIEPFLINKFESLVNNHIKCTLQPVFLLRGEVGSGADILVRCLSDYFGLHFFSESCRKIVSTTAKQTESKIEAIIQRAKKCAPVLVQLQDFDMFGVDSENSEDIRVIEYFIKKLNQLFINFTKFPIIFILNSSLSHEFKPNLKRVFLDEMQINTPELEERLDMLMWLCLKNNVQLCDDSFKQIHSIINKEETDYNAASHQSILRKHFLNKDLMNILNKVASKTQGFLFGDLSLLVDQVIHNGFMMQDNSFEESKSLCNEKCIGLVREKDFEDSLEIVRKLHSNKFGTLKIPNVQWCDIGGLEELKKEISRTIELPLKYPHLLANTGLKRSGLLLWGPPGCGKTLVARAIASQLKATFLSVKGPELLDMYVGQSEKNMRDIFSAARSSAPCVIFMDEAEAIAGARGAAGDAGGAADRLVSQLLAELDGVGTQSHQGPVIVIAATNRPDLVEPALLRPGRLDKLLYVGPYVGVQSKLTVLNAVTRNYTCSKEVDLKQIATQLPDKCTGADLASIVNNSRRRALARTISKVECGEIQLPSLCEKDVVIEMADFKQSIKEFTPSVSIQEMEHYESLRTKLS